MTSGTVEVGYSILCVKIQFVLWLGAGDRILGMLRTVPWLIASCLGV